MAAATKTEPGSSTPVEAATLPACLLTEHGALVAADFAKGRLVLATTRRESMRAALADHGVDVVLVHLAAPTFAQAVTATTPEGHLVPAGRTAGSEANIDLDQVSQRRLTVRGVSLRFTRTQEMADVVAGLMPKVILTAERGDIRAVVDSTYDVTEHEKGVARLRSGENVARSS